MNLSHNLGLLIVLAVVGLLLPLCEGKTRRNEPTIFDADEGDDSLLL